jgi:hypothetical protein
MLQQQPFQPTAGVMSMQETSSQNISQHLGNQSLGNNPSELNVESFASLLAAPLKLFGDAVSTTGPAMTSIHKVSHEVMDLATRRTQALIEMPTKAIQCKNPLDLASITAEFWQTAWTQQIDCAKKIASAVGASLPSGTTQRDVLSVPEDRPMEDWNDHSGRRAA